MLTVNQRVLLGPPVQLPASCHCQDGENAYIRINFNFGPSYEPSAQHPTAICLKELSFRTSDVRHAAKASMGEGMFS